MKIGIDVRAACQPKDGKGVYTYNIVKGLLNLDAAAKSPNEFLLYTNEISGKIAEMVNGHSRTHIKIIHGKGFMWHFRVMRDLIKEAGEIFFAPTSFIIPAFLPKKIRSVITVHDLIAFLFPAGHETKAKILEWIFLRRALKKSSAILAPSENTKRDLQKLFRVPEEKITVTPLGVDIAPAPHIPTSPHPPLNRSTTQSPLTKNNLGEKYQLPEEFILTVGALNPRKNIVRIIDAFLEVRKKFPHLGLVIVGGKSWKFDEVEKKIAAFRKTHRDKIIHIEHCDREELAALYHAAKVFVFASLYEGFGLPPLEAMTAGCPVVCSRAASLPEVCDDAALYVNPEKADEIAHALEKILHDKNLQHQLREKSLNQAKKFSWKKTAEATLKVFAGGSRT